MGWLQNSTLHLFLYHSPLLAKALSTNYLLDPFSEEAGEIRSLKCHHSICPCFPLIFSLPLCFHSSMKDYRQEGHCHLHHSFGFMENPQTPEGGKQEGKAVTEKVPCPLWVMWMSLYGQSPEPQLWEAGKRRGGCGCGCRRQCWEGSQGEFWRRWTHSLGRAALAPNLGQTLALNDDRSNDLCLSGPSWQGPKWSSQKISVTLEVTGRTKPHFDKAFHPTHPHSGKPKSALVKLPSSPQLW